MSKRSIKSLDFLVVRCLLVLFVYLLWLLVVFVCRISHINPKRGCPHLPPRGERKGACHGLFLPANGTSRLGVVRGREKLLDHQEEGISESNWMFVVLDYYFSSRSCSFFVCKDRSHPPPASEWSGRGWKTMRESSRVSASYHQ